MKDLVPQPLIIDSKQSQRGEQQDSGHGHFRSPVPRERFSRSSQMSPTAGNQRLSASIANTFSDNIHRTALLACIATKTIRIEGDVSPSSSVIFTRQHPDLSHEQCHDGCHEE